MIRVNEAVYAQLLDAYRARYGSDPEVVAYAPGRIEVLGNHTDYNEGFVLSAAIPFGTFFAAARADTAQCRLTAGDLMKEVAFDTAALRPASRDTWQNYVVGTFAGLIAEHPVDRGFDGMFLGNIPLGSGLSSSAALEMSAGLALASLYGIKVDTVGLARIGQRAEHLYAGCKCGLLDQLSSLAGERDKLVKTDFRSVSHETVALGEDACFLMCNTHAKHALTDGAYNRLREACETATAHFARVLRHPVRALRDVSLAEWAIYRKGLPEDVADRAAHPIGENERVLAGAARLACGDLAGFGALMYDSHASSRVLFNNSCDELDAVVDAARSLPDVLGARLSGGGFGGSVVALTHPDRAESAASKLAEAYAARFGAPCDVRVIRPSDGARVVRGG